MIFISLVFSKTFYVSNNPAGKDGMSINEVTQGLKDKVIRNKDSVLFKRGERFFGSVKIPKEVFNYVYFGAYGDTLLPKPIMDGSVLKFDFDSEMWKDFEFINNVKFYKKKINHVDQVVNVYAGKSILTLAREPDSDESVVFDQNNSYEGFFQIDSVHSDHPKKIFYDFENTSDWTGADIVVKTQEWSYEIRELKTNGPYYEVSEQTVDTFKKGWGYFIQRHYSALDKVGEWFYDTNKGILFFSPSQRKCEIYITGTNNENISAFQLDHKYNIEIQDLHFINYKFGLKIEHSKNIKVENCKFENCIYGIFNNKSYLENVEYVNNDFINNNSYGIYYFGNNSTISNNYIDSIGLYLNCESRGFNNLDGIEVHGRNNIISNNTIKNIGYCGIRLYEGSGSKIEGNTIENTMLVMSDGGAIYSYHDMTGNKLIRGNKIVNSIGNVSGTTSSKYNAYGIYLDELSLHFRVESNYISDTGTAIYLQNSRSDTVINNVTKNSLRAELHINHAGSILNGGYLNPDNDPDFNPDNLKVIPDPYIWDSKEKILKNKLKNKIVYVEPGNNLISNNKFYPSISNSTFYFRTWRNITDNIIYELTGHQDFFRNNVPESVLSNASVQIIGGNVKDFYNGGKDYNKVKSNFNKSKYGYLRDLQVFIAKGRKFFVE